MFLGRSSRRTTDTSSIHSRGIVNAGSYVIDGVSGLIGASLSCARAGAAYGTNNDGTISSYSANTIRYNYINGQWCVLAEPAATNLCLHSESMNNAAWIKVPTVTADSIAAPTTLVTADMLTYAGAGSIYQTIAVSASTNYVFSYYVKLGTRVNNRYAIYCATTATFFVPSTVAVGPSTSGWTRVVVPFTTPSTCSSIRVYPDRADTTWNTGTTYIWGCQLELGTVATSYIATTTAAAARAADTLTFTGTNTNDWLLEFDNTRMQAFNNVAGNNVVAGSALNYHNIRSWTAIKDGW